MAKISGRVVPWADDVPHIPAWTPSHWSRTAIGPSVATDVTRRSSIDEKASVVDDRERLRKYIYPHVRDVPLKVFTRAHADLVMARLPAHLKPATRRQVAQLVNRVIRLALFLGIIDRSPLPPGWLPKAPKAESIAKESLLPSEEGRLLAGRNEAGEFVVPIAYRVLYAFLHREGMRKGEVCRLTWNDLDLKRGVVSLDENKTDRPRSWVLWPSIARTLNAWSRMHPGGEGTGPVFPEVKWDKLAPLYRAHCEVVGIDRERLFQVKANKLRLRAHDARAFFITAGIFAGRHVLWLPDRTGHATLAMLRRYERDVRRWRELGEGAPVDADAVIPEIAAAFTAANAAAPGRDSGPQVAATTRKCTGRDLNPKGRHFASRRCRSFFVVRVRDSSRFWWKGSARECSGVLARRPRFWRDFGCAKRSLGKGEVEGRKLFVAAQCGT
jgi:integrase